MTSTVLATVIVSLLELCAASPVYNMQPAYITANIGTTGRNIRNLPCISRKTNQSGVCMFAIDCLKANGTHLGTCIDRFYFGSCCHIAPHHDAIAENTIPLDPELIPPREPPLRLTNTTTTSKPPQTTPVVKDVSVSSSTTEKITTKTTKTPTSSTTERVIISSSSSAIPETTTTEVPYKLTTFQSVESIVNEDTTSPITFVSSTTLKSTTEKTKATPKPSTKLPTTKPTLKPVFNITKPSSRPSSKPTPKPKPTRPLSTPKPTKVTKPTTSKPSVKPSKTTPKPFSKLTTTRKPISTKSPTKPSSPTTKTTPKPSSSPTFVKIPSTEATTTNTTTDLEQTTTPASNLDNVIPPSVSTNTTSVGGNPETNEIEAVVPDKEASTQKVEITTPRPSLVTWGSVDGKNTSDSSNSTKEEPEQWKPLTTPDGWVLLPSVAPTPIAPQPTASTSPQKLSTTEKSTTTTTKAPTTSRISTTTTQASTTTARTTTQAPSTTERPKTTTTSATTTRKAPTTQFSTTAAYTTTTTMSTISLSTLFNTSALQNLSSSASPRPTSSAPVEATTTTEKSSNITSSTPASPLLSSSTAVPGDRPVNMSDFTDVCGRRMFPEARIVGGEKSSFGKWPWQISLRQWRVSTYLHKCGAALLNENWAITAAHCVENVPSSDLLLRLGEHDLSTESEPYLHQERRVQIVVPYPQFDNRTFEYDLALLRFYEPVTFQPNIIPVCVPDNDENFVGSTAHVTGWGRLYEDGPLPSILQEVSVPVINNTVCESMYRSAGYIEHIPHIFICAGWRRGGFDSCEGDSGGPMVIQRPDRRFLLAGVISWGIGCAEPNQPGVYTRISEFRDWINLIIQF